MKRLAVSTHIACGPQAVWDLYADVPGSVDWVPFAEEILYVSGPPGLGQVYRERTRLAGLSSVSEWTIVEWDPPRRQVQLSEAFKMDSRLMIEVTPGETGTRLTQSVELRSQLPGALGRLHEAAFGRVAGRGIRQAVAAARRRLETHSPAHGE
jgi:hypothetical protein